MTLLSAVQQGTIDEILHARTLNALLDNESFRTLLLGLDLSGTFVFALSGAALGVHRRLDLFGVLVLAFAAATAGGISRDVLIGAVPPAALSDWRYFAVAMVAGLIIFFLHAPMNRLQAHVQFFDAAGLALFAVAGTDKALAFGLHPIMAALLGMLTGIGGGMARDLLVVRTPAVLQGSLYAVAALGAALLVATGHLLALPAIPTSLLAAAACFAVRLLAIRYGWNLPSAQAANAAELEEDER